MQRSTYYNFSFFLNNSRFFVSYWRICKQKESISSGSLWVRYRYVHDSFQEIKISDSFERKMCITCASVTFDVPFTDMYLLIHWKMHLPTLWQSIKYSIRFYYCILHLCCSKSNEILLLRVLVYSDFIDSSQLEDIWL